MDPAALRDDLCLRPTLPSAHVLHGHFSSIWMDRLIALFGRLWSRRRLKNNSDERVPSVMHTTTERLPWERHDSRRCVLKTAFFRTGQRGEDGSRVLMIALSLLIFACGGRAQTEHITIPAILLRLGLFVTSTTSVIISLGPESRFRQMTSLACPTSCYLARDIAVHFHRDAS